MDVGCMDGTEEGSGAQNRRDLDSVPSCGVLCSAGCTYNTAFARLDADVVGCTSSFRVSVQRKVATTWDSV